MRKVIYDGYCTITVRELLISIAIIFVLLACGFGISEKISSSCDEQNQEYDHAIKIDGDSELFQYGMRTNVGNAFISGTISAVDTVSYPDISGEYSYLEKVKEKYTKHTRQVPVYDEDGNVDHYKTETYWEWDVVDRDNQHSQTLNFLGVDFSYDLITLPYEYYIDTVDGGYHIRYKYYGKSTCYTGTIYTKLADKTIAKTTLIEGKNANEAAEYMKDSGVAAIVCFWIFWVCLIGGAVYGFCYLDNRWLEE